MLNSLGLKALGIGLACVFFLFTVYFAGYNSARHAGKAEYLALKVEYADKARKDAEAYGKALAVSLEKYQQQVNYAQDLEQRLLRAGSLEQKKRSEIEKEIALVTKASNRTFSIEFIRLYNKAVGATASDTR